MKIDIYAHVCPEKYKIEGTQTLWYLETRFRIMDRYDNYMQMVASWHYCDISIDNCPTTAYNM